MRPFSVVNRFFVLSCCCVAFLATISESSVKCRNIAFCWPTLLRIDLNKLQQLFSMSSIISITELNDYELTKRMDAGVDVCTSYRQFYNCVGGAWWNCVDLEAILLLVGQTIKASGYPGEASKAVEELTPDDLKTALEIGTMGCNNIEILKENSFCIRDSILMDPVAKAFFKKMANDMKYLNVKNETHWPFACRRFTAGSNALIHLLKMGCGDLVANLTYTTVKITSQKFEKFAPDCAIGSFEEMKKVPPQWGDFRKFVLEQQDWNRRQAELSKNATMPPPDGASFVPLITQSRTPSTERPLKTIATTRDGSPSTKEEKDDMAWTPTDPPEVITIRTTSRTSGTPIPMPNADTSKTRTITITTTTTTQTPPTTSSEYLPPNHEERQDRRQKPLQDTTFSIHMVVTESTPKIHRFKADEAAAISSNDKATVENSNSSAVTAASSSCFIHIIITSALAWKLS